MTTRRTSAPESTPDDRLCICGCGRERTSGSQYFHPEACKQRVYRQRQKAPKARLTFTDAAGTVVAVDLATRLGLLANGLTAAVEEIQELAPEQVAFEVARLRANQAHAEAAEAAAVARAVEADRCAVEAAADADVARAEAAAAQAATESLEERLATALDEAAAATAAAAQAQAECAEVRRSLDAATVNVDELHRRVETLSATSARAEADLRAVTSEKAALAEQLGMLADRHRPSPHHPD